jgi:nucleoid-associated protein YgaU
MVVVPPTTKEHDMGLLDFVKDAGSKIFGKDDDRKDVTKPLSTHLRENGIDPSGISFRFQGDGSTVTMQGTVKDQETREKAVLVVGNVEGVARVDDQLRVARPAPTSVALPAAPAPPSPTAPRAAAATATGARAPTR